MEVEKINLSLLPFLLETVDKRKAGVTIDVGVGTANLYCLKFSNLGYKTYAIEPLPDKNLEDLCERNNITLIESVLGKNNGTVDIYTGVFKGEHLTDVSSINPNWWGVDKASKKNSVQSISLDKLIETFNIKEITYLKVDTEGSELDILSQIPNISSESYPKIIEFEYGGGAKKQEKKGGWNDEFFSNTCKSLKILNRINYKYGCIIERENSIVKCFSNDSNLDLDSLFKGYYVYGNLLFSQEDIFDEARLNIYLGLPERKSLKEKLKTLFK